MSDNIFWSWVWLSIGMAIALVTAVSFIGATASTDRFVKGGYIEKYECSQMSKVWVKP